MLRLPHLKRMFEVVFSHHQTRWDAQLDPRRPPSVIPTRHTALPAHEETFLLAGKER